MDVKDFKKVGRTLKEIYKKIKEELIASGISPLQREFDEIFDEAVTRARNEVLESRGFTLEEYRAIRDKIVGMSKADMVDAVDKVHSKLDGIRNSIPTDTKIEEMAEEIAERVAKTYIKEPVIINKIVKEITVKEPKIIKETVKVKERVEYNDKKLKKQLADISAKVEEIKDYDDAPLKDYFHNYFSDNFKKNIDMLGMPDFRKLAMGLRGDIDELKNTIPGAATWPTITGDQTTVGLAGFTNDGGFLTSLTGALLATGATTGATSQAQTFTNGVITPKIYPLADSTTALQITKADGTTNLTSFDTTNNRQVFQRDALGATYSTSLYLVNTTPTTAEATTQYSPSLQFRSRYYSGGDKSWDFRIQAQEAKLNIQNSNNGGTFYNVFSLTYGGVLSIGGGFYAVGSVNASTANLTTVSTDGVVINESTLSTVGVPVRYSPRLRFTGHAWNTTATAADNSINWIQEVRPTSGATTAGSLYWAFDNNGGGYTDKMYLNSSGGLYMADVYATNAHLGNNGVSRTSEDAVLFGFGAPTAGLAQAAIIRSGSAARTGGTILFEIDSSTEQWRIGNNFNFTNTGGEGTAYLHLKAGTATAGTAPLKINAGTVLTTTEAGTIENDGTHLYYTAADAGTRYQLDQQTTGYALVGQTFYIGTTQVAINRASAALTLAGITLTTPDIGTPSAGVLTSCTGLPYSGIADGTDGNLITWGADGHAALVATGNAGQVLTSNGAGAAPTFQASAGGSSFWTAVAMTRTGNTTIETDADVDLSAVLAKGMIIKWTDTTTHVGMIISVAYSSPHTTITIIGMVCAATASAFKYAMVGAEPFIARFAAAGTLGATASDFMNAYYATEPMTVLGADVQVGTAGTTNSTTFDINKNGTTMFTTKPTLATTVASSPTAFTADDNTSLALGDRVSIDLDAVQTTAAIDAYVQLYLYPTRYLSLT